MVLYKIDGSKLAERKKRFLETTNLNAKIGLQPYLENEMEEGKLQAFHKKVLKACSSYKLCIIQVGEDQASNIYVNKKSAEAKKIGIDVKVIKHREGITEFELIEQVLQLNSNPDITAIMIQTPIMGITQPNIVLNSISPKKDVDGLSAYSLGLVMQTRTIADLNILYGNTEIDAGRNSTIAEEVRGFLPATPKAIIDCITYSYFCNEGRNPCVKEEVDDVTFKDYFIGFSLKKLKYLQKNLKGTKSLIINDSAILGRPLFNILTTLGSTCTMAHVNTKNIEELVLDHDIVVTAVGKNEFSLPIDLFANEDENFIGKKLNTNVMEGEQINKVVGEKDSTIARNNTRYRKIIIDAGVNKRYGKLSGDIDYTKYELVDFNSTDGFDLGSINQSDLNGKRIFLTPTPNGVGPLTVANLLENCVM